MTVPLVTLERLAEIVSTCSTCSMCREFAVRALEARTKPELEWSEDDAGGVALGEVPALPPRALEA